MHATEPNLKRKNRSPLRIMVNQWGCLLAFVMLGLGSVFGLLAAIFIGPQILGFDVTATALMEREIILAATAADLDSRAQDANAQATVRALDALATQAILNNDIDLLNQTATQSQQNIVATTTASAAQSAQRQTQVANDFTSTQAALNANATQVELDFRNTQAALGITVPSAQNIAQSVTNCEPSVSFTTEITIFESDWIVSNATDWDNITGLRALNDGAWLLESDKDNESLVFCDYANTHKIEYTLRPVASTEDAYWLFFGVNQNDGLAMYIRTEMINIVEVALYQFDMLALQDDTLTLDDSLTVISRVSANTTLSSQVNFQIDIVEERLIRLIIADTLLLEVNGFQFDSGRVGVQLPEGAVLENISTSN